MPSDGSELLALWRESGAWWAGERPMEVRRTRKPSGKLDERFTPLRTPWQLQDQPTPLQENHREEVELRPRKKRDEKVGRACGYVHEAATLAYTTTQTIPYAPLHALSGYSFGHATLFAEEIPRRCALLGIPCAALTDYFSLAGVVEFTHEAEKCGVRPLIGATLQLETGGNLGIIVQSTHGYIALSQCLTECHLSQPRGFPLASINLLRRYARDWLILTGGDDGPLNPLLAARRYGEADQLVDEFVSIAGPSRVFIEIERNYLPWEIQVNHALLQLAERHKLMPVAGGKITHSEPKVFPAQDVLVCAETLCTVDELIGRKPQRDPSQTQIRPRPLRALNAERYLRSPKSITALYADRPDLLQNTLHLAELCDSSVLPSRTKLPDICDNPAYALRETTYREANMRIGRLNDKHKRRIDHELNRIISLGFANHFLVAHDFCNWSREQQILFSARGSVVDSFVSYCLGFSRIDAMQHNLLFDRFLPCDGSKRPDIDIDFEAKRRDDVRAYLEDKFGRDHVATVAAFGAFCVRGIVREVGKALGIPPTLIDYLSKRIHGGVSPGQLESAMERKPELMRSGIPKERFQWVFRLAEWLTDVPRNIRAHSSGVVISSEPICNTVPVLHSASEQASGPLRIMQWDKRSAKFHFDKFDILCLRGQDVLSGSQQHIRAQNPEFEVTQIPLDDEETYRTFRSGALIGIPQSASPAMRQAHVRIQTQNLVDASLVQAGIRPGVGGAVKMNELIARRRGLTAYTFEHPLLHEILGKTYGIVVFQEQIDQLLQAFCHYQSGEAEDIRDKIHKRRREDYGQLIRDELIRKMLENGFTQTVAEHVFELVAGFKGYGFAEGHALAFAEISVRSIYCQQNFPAEYFASLFSAQPAGYYGPCTLANEARNRGLRILQPCVLHSQEAFGVEDVVSEMDPKIKIPNGAVRVGLMQVSGISKQLRKRVLQHDFSNDFFHFCRSTRPNRDELETLVLSGSLDALWHNRKQMLWSIPEAMEYAQRQNALELPPRICSEFLDDFSEIEKAVHERAILGMDVRQHLMAFERERVTAKGGMTTTEVNQLKPGTKAIVVGNPTRLRFPPTPSGKRVVFFDLEDETGLLNVTCFDRVYQRDGQNIVCSPYVTVSGVVQDRDGHPAFLAQRVFAFTPKKILENIRVDEIPIPVADFLVG